MKGKELISTLGVETILEKLKDDNEYYNGIGTEFFSNSNMGTLIKEPQNFKKDVDRGFSLPLFRGSYVHHAILEPEKVDRYEVIDVASRDTKKFRDACPTEECFTRTEKAEADKWVNRVLGSSVVRDFINGAGVEYEVPMVGQIQGEWFKGKADILDRNNRLIIDLKTSGYSANFQSSADKWNYDSQAYVYRELFGYDMMFLVIDKRTLDIRIFDCDDSFYEKGRAKVEQALGSYYTNVLGQLPPSSDNTKIFTGTLT